MDVLKHSRAVKPLATMIVVAAAAAPAAAHGKGLPVAATAAEQGAQSKPAGDRAGNGLAKHERAYIEVRRKVVKRFDAETAGRNIVRDGYREKGGEVRKARKGEVVESTELMRSWLSGGEVTAAAEDTATETGTEPAGGGYETETAGAPTSVIECESGGDYGAVNPAGYYGAYQFDQSTWDAYAPSEYAGTNPAQAPPAVQDAAAANVDYDAWPNC
jgi:hypothetical protein